MRVLAVVFLIVATGFLRAAPVEEEARTDIDFRRTTLVVRDIEQSLSFYRDALGLKVLYDQQIYTPRDASDLASAERGLRLVFLRSNDDFVGVLGLMQYLKPEKEAANQGAEPFSIGSLVMVFNTDNLDAKFAKARNALGVRVLREPTETTYPSYDGASALRVRVSVLVDPDGNVVELNQLLTKIRSMNGRLSLTKWRAASRRLVAALLLVAAAMCSARSPITASPWQEVTVSVGNLEETARFFTEIGGYGNKMAGRSTRLRTRLFGA